MKILIAGYAKTGTTGLFFKIKNSIKEEIRELFEIRNYQPIPGEEKKTILAKVLIGAGNYEWNYKSYFSFDKKIFLIRDPRDTFISYLLYRILHSRFLQDKEKVKIYIDLVRKKEDNPDSVNVKDIIKLFYELNERCFDDAVFKNDTTNQTNFLFDFFDGYRDFFILKYEDFVDGKLEKLEEYLGFRLSGSSDVGEQFQRVARTKSYNNWKDWFTEEDAAYYKPLFSKFMSRFGYNDWQLNDNKKILYEHASGYIERILKGKIKWEK